MRFFLLACLALVVGCSQKIVDRPPATGSELALPAASDTSADDGVEGDETKAASNASEAKEQPGAAAAVPELPSYVEALDIADHEARLVQVAKFDLDGHQRQQARLQKQRDDAGRPGAKDSPAKPNADNLAALDADLQRVSQEIEASKETLRRAEARLDYATNVVNQIIKRDGREKSAE